MTLSFGEYDDDVYYYLQGLKNASGLVRQLVRVHMSQNNVQTTEKPLKPTVKEDKNDEIAVTKEAPAPEKEEKVVEKTEKKAEKSKKKSLKDLKL